MSTQEYFPSEKEKNYDLKELFRAVNHLIAKFVENNNHIPEDKVRRYVCGNIFVDRLDEFHGKIQLLKGAPVTEWQVLLSEMFAENNQKPKAERLSFGELSTAASAKRNLLGEEEKKRLASIVADRNAAVPSFPARVQNYEDEGKLKLYDDELQYSCFFRYLHRYNARESVSCSDAY